MINAVAPKTETTMEVPHPETKADIRGTTEAGAVIAPRRQIEDDSKDTHNAATVTRGTDAIQDMTAVGRIAPGSNNEGTVLAIEAPAHVTTSADTRAAGTTGMITHIVPETAVHSSVEDLHPHEVETDQLTSEMPSEALHRDGNNSEPSKQRMRTVITAIWMTPL